ncbi:DUF4174 domain-containing protein [Psychroserpens mesophilus]|uniref:DUF4174 domain-containing protein n=1 Tax=Psychroserpens mesophilus TaxID=325473 RepID=UPI00058D9D9A|nr:DUF4174 domain-containing protein [Psychroserpens mesophilus]
MKLQLLLITLILIAQTNSIKGQNLKSHRWNDRVLLVITDSETNLLFQQQMQSLEVHRNALDNRKLIVYQVTSKAFKTGFVASDIWIKSSNLYSSFNSESLSFKVVLIGLDGRIKLEQNECISIEKLCNTIDRMPMRRAELSRSKKAN